MRKSIVLIGLVISLMVTGCTKSEEPKNEEVTTTIVYCDSCGEESNEVTKFCSNCGEEAKWLAEKPEKTQKEDIEEIVKEEVNEEDLEKEQPNNEEVSAELNQDESKELTYCSICTTNTDIWGLVNSEYGLVCHECKLENNKFTGVEAIYIAEDYFNSSDDGDTFYEYDTEVKVDSRGAYYKVFVKSEYMQAQGGNGTLFAVLVYEDGTVVEL